MMDSVGVNIVQDDANTRYLEIDTGRKRNTPVEINVVDGGFSTIAVQNPTDYVLYVVKIDAQKAQYSEQLIAKISPLTQQNFLVRNGKYFAYFSQIPCWPSAKKAINDVAAGPVLAPKNNIATVALIPQILPPYSSASTTARYTLLQPGVAVSPGGVSLYAGFFLRNSLYPAVGVLLNNLPPNLADPSSGIRPLPPLKRAWLTITRNSLDNALAALTINAIRMANLAQIASLTANAPERLYAYDGNLVTNSDSTGGNGAISETILVGPTALPINVDLSPYPADYFAIGMTATVNADVDVSLALEFDCVYWPYE